MAERAAGASPFLLTQTLWFAGKRSSVGVRDPSSRSETPLRTKRNPDSTDLCEHCEIQSGSSLVRSAVANVLGSGYKDYSCTSRCHLRNVSPNCSLSFCGMQAHAKACSLTVRKYLLYISFFS